MSAKLSEVVLETEIDAEGKNRAVNADAAPRPASAGDLTVAVIIPVLNEFDNVRPLLAKLDDALTGVTWEAVFVDDDSTDGTADLVREIGRNNPRVRVVQRIGRRGLSTAVIEGMLATPAPYLAVIDGDMQHDERILPDMLHALRADGYDLAVGSRYVEGGGFGDWEESRQSISKFATRLSDMVLKNVRLSDPMSGFFMVTREAFTRSVRETSGIGFKILLDLVASSPEPLKVKELPYEFRTRVAGESKLDSAVAWEYLVMLLDKMVGHIVPVRFVMFAAIGGLGLIVHLAVLGVAFKALAIGFAIAQGIATIVAMTFNYILNNFITYRDKRLTGTRFFTGLLSFYAICAVGAIGNVGVAQYIYNLDTAWWLSAIAGVLVGVVWNYGVSSVLTWKK
ncbi:MAG: glycosyltransferase family 2 protein [Pseudomonadota bacterium]